MDGDEAYQCQPQLLVQGFVFDAETEEAIEGAHVIAFDGERRALSDVSVTDEDGEYEMTIPAVRDEEGEPIQQFFTLRASAQDYQTFPEGLRQAQPIDASEHDEDDGRLIIDTAQTDIALIELPQDERGYPHISGTVDVDGGLGGVLVVAEPDGVDPSEVEENIGISAASGLDGSFTIFNVPPDDYVVRGHIADYQLDPEPVAVDDENIDDVILTEAEDDPADVTGQIQIVRGEGQTSVLLMVASTYDEVTRHGEAPAGLRAPRTGPGDIDGSWTIEGVPAGDYVAVAGYEADGFARFLDEGVAGTELVYFTVDEGDEEIDLGDSFKVVEALETFGPGADGPEGVADKPTLSWGPISNGDHYDVIVFDALGNVTFEEEQIPHEGGKREYEIEYDGEFDEGMYYQFRATAHRMGSQQTTTEMLLGVFYAE